MRAGLPQLNDIQLQPPGPPEGLQSWAFLKGSGKNVGFSREAVLPLQKQRAPVEKFATGSYSIQPAQVS